MGRGISLLLAALMAAYCQSAIAYGVDMEPNLPEAVTLYKKGKYKEAFKAIQRLAREGSYPAQGILGLMYSKGDGVAADQAEALRWLTLAAEGRDQEALNWLGGMHAKGIGVAADPVKAAEFYRRSAEEGSAAGANNLAMALEEGRGVAKDLDAARRYYEIAVLRDSGHARVNLGKMLLASADAQERARGEALVRERAMHGDATAQEYLGELLSAAGKDDEALDWMVKAIAAGNTDAARKLVELLMAKHPSRAIPQQAIDALDGATGTGDADAAKLLARLAEVGHGQRPPDRAAAIAWYKRAASLGSAEARVALARLDPSAGGPALTGEMASLGNLDAVYNLAVTSPRKEALRLYEYAASRGHEKAEYNLAVMLMNGSDKAEQEAAVAWMRKSASRGNAAAQNNLAVMLDEKRQMPEALQWYLAAAEGGSASAQSNLGSIYRIGRGTQKDLAKAKYWYEKAAAQGHAVAIQRLDTMAQRGEFDTPKPSKARAKKG